MIIIYKIARKRYPVLKISANPLKIWSTKSQKQICKTLEAIPSAAFCFLDLMLITRHSLCYVHYFELSAIRSSSIRDSLHLSHECLFSYVELDLSNRFGNFIKRLVGNVASRWRGYFRSIVLSTRVTGREKKTRSTRSLFSVFAVSYFCRWTMSFITIGNKISQTYSIPLFVRLIVNSRDVEASIEYLWRDHGRLHVSRANKGENCEIKTCRSARYGLI